MSEETLVQEVSAIEARFPGIVAPEERKSYEGYIVEAQESDRIRPYHPG